MKKFCGARSAAAFQHSIYMPHPSTLTYEGLFGENFFKLNNTTDELLDVEISQAQVTSPIDGKQESWLGLITKSNYDGVGLRKPIDIALTLDISGSMSGANLSLAKIACIKLFKLLSAEDHISFSTFNNQAHRIFGLTQGDKLSQKNEEMINEIQVDGGTTVYSAIKDCYDILKESKNKNKRMILVTDMCDNCNDDRLIDLMKLSASEGIFVTFIGISYECNTSLTEALSHVKGSNYFVANTPEEIEKYLVEEFKFICFPTCTNVHLELCSNNLKAVKCVGTGFNMPKEHTDKNKEWLTKNHKENTDEFKKKINFVLMYFNRINKRLPLPVLASISNYIRYEKKTVCEINTVFPSAQTKQSGDVFVEGGMILLKLQKESTVNEHSCEIKLKFESNEGELLNKNYVVRMRHCKENEDYFSDQVIKNALCLNYYAKYCRRMMKAENAISKNKDKIAFKQDFRKTVDNSSVLVKEFIDKYMEEHYSTDKKEKYIQKISDLVKMIHDNIEKEKLNVIELEKFNAGQAKKKKQGINN